VSTPINVTGGIAVTEQNWWDIEDLEERQRAWEKQGIGPWHIEDPEEKARAQTANSERVDYVLARHRRIVAEGKNCSECGAEIGDTVYRYKPLLEYGQYRRMPTTNADPTCEACAPDWLPKLENRVYKIHMYSHRMACELCARGVVFVSASKNPPRVRVFCSENCRNVHKENKRKARTTGPHKEACGVCGGEFIAKRSDAKTCSPACRQKLYRRRLQASVGAVRSSEV
jgi:predicted nucleic acid-binding Zn ribbon protein